MPNAVDIECFGHVANATSRTVSHNDQWILCSAIVHGHALVTEDERLHTADDGDGDGELHQAILAAVGLTIQAPVLV